MLTAAALLKANDDISKTDGTYSLSLGFNNNIGKGFLRRESCWAEYGKEEE